MKISADEEIETVESSKTIGSKSKRSTNKSFFDPPIEQYLEP